MPSRRPIAPTPRAAARPAIVWPALAAAAALAAALTAAPVRAADEPDYSPAERLVFMTEQLRNVKPPATLHYRFSKSGSMEEAFDDGVSIRLEAQPGGACCSANGDFLSGTHAVKVPPVEEARANPVILYFLERDVAEMHRLTKGSQNYFRKRVRMAIYNGAAVKDVTLNYRGQRIAAQEVAIAPYLDDPARSRYEQFVRKRYVFWLSEAVPGGVYGIRTTLRADGETAAPLMVEQLFIDGAEPPAAALSNP